jgi:hypothetical protein
MDLKGACLCPSHHCFWFFTIETSYFWVFSLYDLPSVFSSP